MRASPHLSLPVLLFLLQGLSGCASAGPDLRGPEGPGLMAAYSGDWVLVPEQSENLNRKMEEGMRRPTGGPGGGMTGGRPGGGMPPGGMGGARPGGGRRGGMPSSGVDPEEMRRSMEALRKLSSVPSEVSLVLQPETVTFTQNATNVLMLTFGEEKERVVQEGALLLGQAKWSKDGIEITRNLEAGPGIKDKFILDDRGNLVLEREVDLMGRAVKGKMLYRKRSVPS